MLKTEKKYTAHDGIGSEIYIGGDFILLTIVTAAGCTNKQKSEYVKMRERIFGSQIWSKA
jgi:hypothetical protein